MACRINRNAQGQIETVFNEDGLDSNLFQDINKEFGHDPESALVAYLTVKEYLDSNNRSEDSVTLSSPAVQRILAPLIANTAALEEETAQLKEDMLQSKVGDSLHYLFEKLGVDVKILESVTDVNGNTIDNIAAADISNRLIELTKSGTDISILTEEASHFIVEVLKAQKHPLYDVMRREVVGTEIYKNLMDPNSDHYALYNGNEDLIAREAMGKLIHQELVKGETKEKKTFRSRLSRWFAKVLEHLNRIFGRAHVDPFVKTAHDVLNKNLDSYFNDMSKTVELVDNKFYNEGTRQQNIISQLDAQAGLYEIEKLNVEDVSSKVLRRYFNKLSEDGMIERYVGKKGTIYEGKTLKKRGSDSSSLKFAQNRGSKYRTAKEAKLIKDMQDIRMNTGTKGHLVMEELIKKFTGQGNKSYSDILTQSGPLFTKNQFDILISGAKFLIKEIKAQQAIINKETASQGKFKIITEQFVSDEKNDIGGTIDVLVIFSDGSASIYDWKFKSPRIGSNAESSKSGVKITGDMYASSLEGYDNQINAYKDALLSKYGVTKVRHSRVVPISVMFKRDENNIMTDTITYLDMWTGQDTDSRFLEHIPVANEMTDDESINKLIRAEMSRYNSLARKVKHAAFSDRAALEKRMSDSRLIIKRLQIDQEVGQGIVESFRILRQVHAGLGVEEEFRLDENGETILNPMYLTDAELIELYEELQHFLAFSSLPEVRASLQKSDTKQSKALLDEMAKSSFEISTTIEQMKVHMINRIDKKARGKNINNIKYNRKGTLEAWIPSSAHKSPYSRYIYDTMNKMKTVMIRKEKELAQEIYEYEQELFAWGESNGYNNVNVFDLLINPATHNLHAKYSEELYDRKNKSMKAGNIGWMKTYYTPDMIYYNKEYKNWEQKAFKSIDSLNLSKEAKDSKKQQWKKEHDVLTYESAWLGKGGQYFTKLNEEAASEFLTPAYRKIQSNEPLKNFYEFHIRKIHDYEKMFGMKLGPTFIGNVQQSLVDSILESDSKVQAFKESGMDALNVKQHNMDLGSVDLEGNFIREIPRLYTRELTNSEGEIDRSLRSRELGRSLYLLGQAAMEYEYLNSVKDDLLLLELILKEGMIGEVQEDLQGKPVQEAVDQARKIFGNAQQNSSELFTDMINESLYNKKLKTKDIVTDSGFSYLRAGLAAKSFSSISALGLKVPVALGAFGAGIAGLHIQAAKGIHYTNEQLWEAEKAIIGRDPKVRAIMEHFEIMLIDQSKRRGDELASNWKSKYLTQDRWFEFLAQADKALDATLGVAMAKNHGIDENGQLKRLSQLPEGTVSLYDSIEVTDNPKWKKGAPIDKYTVKIPSETDDSYGSFRARVHRMSSKVKGTSSPEDLTTAKQHLINRFFMHYRSWLPGIALERFGQTKYDHVMEQFDQGTWRGFFGNFGPETGYDDMGQILDVEVAATEYLMEIGTDIVKLGLDVATFGYSKSSKIKEKKARNAFENHLMDNVGNEEYDFKTPEAKELAFQEFLKMKQGNLRAMIAEVRAVALLFLMISLAGGDYDDDGKTDIRQTWIGRKMHNVLGRVYRETAIFLDPTEMTGPRASGIPLLSLGADLVGLGSNSLDEIRDAVFGENDERDLKPPGYQLLKFAPGINGVAKAFEIYPQYKYARQ